MEELGGLAGEAGETQEDLKGEESKVAVESSPLIGSSLIGKRSQYISNYKAITRIHSQFIIYN